MKQNIKYGWKGETNVAGEIAADASSSLVLYSQIRNRTSGFIFNISSGQFETYSSASGNQAAYALSMSEQGSCGHYVGNAPSTLPAGVFDITCRQRVNAWYAETDSLVANGELQWNTSVAVPLSNLPASGVISEVRMTRGVMVQNFGIFLKSSADHLTNFTSGNVSGQIARDGGLFGALQSGGFTETGLGSYVVTLTSGDLLANTVRLYFSANGISGGTSDPLTLSFVLQRSSGQ
ncbi:hypothetical protein C4577_03715 [Candidatus Parcubacteria bacterium]|nr:MAG: hypothetical protein C4577_03715 [Candidatus Parcubacteria bacterium]